MLKEYSNSKVTDTSYRINGKYKLIERYDLHFQDFRSDKVYICTLQEWSDGADKNYEAIAYYGRRGSSLTRVGLGVSKELADAHKLMDKQMKSKEKKGYNLVGHWVDESLKASANGALRKEVVELIQERFPSGSTIESPTTGQRGEIFGYTDSAVAVSVNGKEIEIPFDKIGYFKVIS